MNIEPAPSADEAAAIIAALTAFRVQEPPARHSAWRLAGRIPWQSDDAIRTMAAHNRKP